jgi:hypothetical protein
MALPKTETMELHFIVPKNVGLAFKHLAAAYSRSLSAHLAAYIRFDNNAHMRVLNADERALLLRGELRIETTEWFRRRHPSRGPGSDDRGGDDDRDSPDAGAPAPERVLEDTAA